MDTKVMEGAQVTQVIFILVTHQIIQPEMSYE